jgi:hypothetical protein
LPEAVAQESLTPLEYMQKYRAFAIPAEKVPVFTLNERELNPAELEGTHIDE